MNPTAQEYSPTATTKACSSSLNYAVAEFVPNRPDLMTLHAESQLTVPSLSTTAKEFVPKSSEDGDSCLQLLPKLSVAATEFNPKTGQNPSIRSSGRLSSRDEATTNAAESVMDPTARAFSPTNNVPAAALQPLYQNATEFFPTHQKINYYQQQPATTTNLRLDASEFVPYSSEIDASTEAVAPRANVDSFLEFGNQFPGVESKTKQKTICRFFKQGACRHGIQCPFSHEIHYLDTPSVQKEDDVTTQQEMKGEVLYVVDEGIRCQFGHGARVLQLRLGANEASSADGSTRLLISGLTAETRDFDLEARLSAFGHIATLHRKHESYAYCTFEKPESAASAASTLNGTPQATWDHLVGASAHTPDSTRKKRNQRNNQKKTQTGFVSVALVAETGAAVSALRNATVKLQWYAPSRVAWLHFHQRSQAEKLARVSQGKLFKGRAVSCRFQRPNFNQTRSFSVWVGGLAEDVNEEHLSQFVAKFSSGVKPSSVQLEKAPFRDKAGAQVIRSLLLSKGGPLAQFDEDKDNYRFPHILKRKALAKFTKVEDADKACAYFQSTDRVPELGGSKVHCQRVFSAKFTVPTNIFLLVQDACINAINSGRQDGPQLAPTLRFKVFHNENMTSSLLVQSDNAKKLAPVKAQLSDIVDGELLLDPSCKQEQKVPMWKDFFASRDIGELVIEKVLECLGHNTAAVLFHKRRREVRLFAKESMIHEARAFVLELLTSLKPMATAVPITPEQYTFLLSGGRTVLDTLIKRCHANCVSLDPRHRSLLVEGSPGDARRAVTCLGRMMCTEKSMDGDDRPCPVCFCDPDDDDVELSCSHRYCRDCLHAWLCSGRQTCTFPIQCIGEGCSQNISVEQLGKLLPRPDFLALLRSAVDSHVLSNLSQYQFCASAGCNGIYALPDAPSRTATCSACQMTLCCSCKVQEHEGLTCEQYKIAKLPPNRLRNHIVEEILTLKCPRCYAAFLDFDGCFALTCSNCKCGFCGWCLTDCGRDAHPHLLSCSSKPKEARNETYFGTSQQFQGAQRKRRRQELIRFLRTLDCGEEQRAALKSIAQDLQDLGLTDVTINSLYTIYQRFFFQNSYQFRKVFRSGERIKADGKISQQMHVLPILVSSVLSRSVADVLSNVG